MTPCAQRVKHRKSANCVSARAACDRADPALGPAHKPSARRPTDLQHGRQLSQKLHPQRAPLPHPPLVRPAMPRHGCVLVIDPLDDGAAEGRDEERETTVREGEVRARHAHGVLREGRRLEKAGAEGGRWVVRGGRSCKMSAIRRREAERSGAFLGQGDTEPRGERAYETSRRP